MKLYCPSCGSGTEYSLNKPQFCASCGSSFTKISTASTAKKVFKPVATVQNTKIEEEEEEEYFSTNIDKLDFNIEVSSRMNHFKIEELAGSNEKNIDDGYRREVDPSYSKDTAEQDFLREAGSSRRNAET